MFIYISIPKNDNEMAVRKITYFLHYCPDKTFWDKRVCNRKNITKMAKEKGQQIFQTFFCFCLANTIFSFCLAGACTFSITLCKFTDTQKNTMHQKKKTQWSKRQNNCFSYFLKWKVKLAAFIFWLVSLVRLPIGDINPISCLSIVSQQVVVS